MTAARQNPRVAEEAIERRLAERTLALVDIPSVSRDEASAMAYVREQLPFEPLWDDGEVLFAATPDTDGAEVVVEESPLPAFFEGCGEIRDAALVIVLEPTNNELHAGCVGNLNAVATFRGTSAHSARPWTGENAIHTALAALAPLASLEPLDVEIDGLVFREVVS